MFIFQSLYTKQIELKLKEKHNIELTKKGKPFLWFLNKRIVQSFNLICFGESARFFCARIFLPSAPLASFIFILCNFATTGPLSGMKIEERQKTCCTGKSQKFGFQIDCETFPTIR